MSAASFPYDIPVSFQFKVKIGDYIGADGSFQDVSGLNVSFDTESINEGGNNTFAHKLPTRPKYENLILKRGMITSSTLVSEWINKAIFNYEFKPLPVTISLLDEKNQPLVSWSLINAYPVSIKLSEFKAMDNSLVIETLELAYHYFTRIK